MILLSGHSLTPARRVPVEALSLSLKERDSTASITPADMTGIGTESWFLDDTNPGSGIVWRVNSIQQAFATDTQSLELEHVINTLRDRILFGEITPAVITGNPDATTCSARAAVSYILAQQNDWVLGSFGYDGVSNPYKFDGNTLYDALEKVTDSLDSAWWSYDLRTYPFKLNITQKPAGVACELRPGRNLSTVTKTIDKSGMYTRFYPIGKDDLHIPGNYVSRNENLYGVISKVEVDQSLETVAELTAWANQRLDRHAEPLVNVTADGLDLSQATGEPLDQLTLGRLCRIPLAEFITTIEERIVELRYADKVHAPENVQITMANAQEDIARIIADEIKNGAGPSGAGGRGGARQDKEDHAWFEDTDTHVAMCAEGIVGIDPETGEPDWARLSEIIVDGEGIHQRVTVMHEDLIEAQAAIEINENSIASEVMRASSVEGTLRSEILQTASMIYSSVEANNSQIYSQVVQTASMIRSEVANALSDFYTAIIQTASSVVIRTGDSTRTYHQPTAPAGTEQDPLVDGDLWFNAEGQFTWGDAEDKSWLDDSSFNWGALKAGDIHRYDGVNEKWVKVVDEEALMQDTRFEQNRERIGMMAGRVDAAREEIKLTRTELRVETEGIRAQMEETATQTNAFILATATRLTSDYTDKVNNVDSHITQTASQILMEVNSTKSELRSSITQEADRISLVVEGYGANAHIKPAQIVASINSSGSNILISANHINLDGYVTASQLNAANARIDNLMAGYSTATKLSATVGSFNNLSFAGYNIYFYAVKTTTGNTIYAMGHA